MLTGDTPLPNLKRKAESKKQESQSTAETKAGHVKQESQSTAETKAGHVGFKGIPLVDVLNVVYMGGHEIEPSKQHGTIMMEFESGNKGFYNYAEKTGDLSNPSIKFGDSIFVTNKYAGPISSLEELDLQFDLFHGAYKGSINLKFDPFQNKVWFEESRIRSVDASGVIYVVFGCLSNATVANLEIQLLDISAPANVHGVIAARNSELDQPSCTSVLFWKSSAKKIEVGHDGVIPLFKSRVGVPLVSKFYVDFSLSIDGEHYAGTASFVPQTNGVKYKDVLIPRMETKIRVQVRWDARKNSVFSTYESVYRKWDDDEYDSEEDIEEEEEGTEDDFVDLSWDFCGKAMSIDLKDEKSGNEKEKYICVGDLIDPEYNSFAANLLSFNVKNKLPIFNRYVEEVKGSNNLLETLVGLDKMINEDPRLSSHLESDVLGRLVKILEDSDCVFLQRSAINIISRANSDTCGTIIKEKALPVLVNLLSSTAWYFVVLPVVIALTRFVSISPDYVSVILDKGALEVVSEIVARKYLGTTLINNLAKFMAVVCRAKILLDKECLALAILDRLLYGRGVGALRQVERACFALQYFSYERQVGIEEGAINVLVQLSHNQNMKAARSAIGVIRNIARWGNSEQIEILAKHSYPYDDLVMY